jgi:Domain of unknown function (DUF5615)
MPGILFDENMEPRFVPAIYQRLPEAVVRRVGGPEAPSDGTPDPDILVWCEAHDFWLVTRNRASMPVHLNAHVAAHGSVPGIFVITRPLSFGQILDELELIWGASMPGEHTNLIRYLPARF